VNIFFFIFGKCFWEFVTPSHTSPSFPKKVILARGTKALERTPQPSLPEVWGTYALRGCTMFLEN